MKQEEKKPTLIPQPKASFTLKHLSDFLEAAHQWSPNFSNEKEFSNWAMQQRPDAMEAFRAKQGSMLKNAINTVSREIQAKLQPLKDANQEVGKLCEDALHSCADETVVEISNTPQGTNRVDRHHFKHDKKNKVNPYKEFMDLVQKYQKEHDEKINNLMGMKVEITPTFANELGVKFELFPEKNNPFRELCKGIVIPADVPMEVTV
jgi:prolyl-tRNA synthetase